MPPHTSASAADLPAAAPSRGPIILLGGFVVLLQVALFNHDFSVDGLAYATAVESGTDLLHPNHLLFAVLHRALWQAVHWFGLGPTRAIWWMQGVTAMSAVVTVLATAAYLVPRAGAQRAAGLGALLACSFAFWNFAQEPEAYVPPLCCVALSLWLLRDPARVPGPMRLLALAGLATLAVLLLQQYVFWYPALLVLLAARLSGCPTRWRRVLLVALVVPLACLLVYLATGLAAGRVIDAASLAPWLLGYGFDPEQGIATYRLAPGAAERVSGLALGLANLVFAYEVARHPVWLGVAAALGLGLLFVLAPAWRAALGRRDRSADAAALLLFAIGNGVFALWWESRNIEFLLPLAFAAVVMAGLGATRLRPTLLAGLVLGVFATNAAVAFWPQRQTPARYTTLIALHVSERLTASDRVIVEELNTVRWLGYFHSASPGFQSGAISAAMHGEQALAAARAQLLRALDERRRVYTTELDERGRLRDLATRFAILGRAGYRGEVETDLDRLYDGLELSPVTGAPGVRRVRRRE